MNPLREFTKDMPIRDSSVTVLLIRPNRIVQSNTVNGKRAIAQEHKKGDRLVALWNGQYSTDAFDLPWAELSRQTL